MKTKIIFIVTMMLFLFSSCYNEDKNATIRINLGNIPVANKTENKSFFEKIFFAFVKSASAQTLPQNIGVIRVHLAAFDGEKNIAKEVVDTSGMTSNVVEFSVPPGENITILVVGENNSNIASYYGYNEVDLSPGKTTDITITVNSAVWSWGSSRTSTYMPVH